MNTKLTVQTKKDTTQHTTWRVLQLHPWPHIAQGYYWDMRGQKLKTEYEARLLRNDVPLPANDDRNDLAGFTPYRSTTPNPGTITLRGRDLGEMELTICIYPDGDTGATRHSTLMRVRGNEHPTDAERAWIEDQIVTPLLDTIADDLDTLRTEAIDATRKLFNGQIAYARESLTRLESEIDKHMAAL
jgi:hypothetical protein